MSPIDPNKKVIPGSRSPISRTQREHPIQTAQKEKTGDTREPAPHKTENLYLKVLEFHGVSVKIEPWEPLIYWDGKWYDLKGKEKENLPPAVVHELTDRLPDAIQAKIGTVQQELDGLGNSGPENVRRSQLNLLLENLLNLSKQVSEQPKSSP